MKYSAGILAALSILSTAHFARAQNLSVYASAPGAQSAQDSGYTSAAGYSVQFEGFSGINAPTTGIPLPTPYQSPSITQTTTTFTTTGGVGVYAPGGSGESQYGGYNQGNFLEVNNGTANTATVTFSTPVAYFGFLFPAADAGSTIQFFGPNNSFIGTFSTSDLTNLLQSRTTLTSVDGMHTYNSSSYFGQPTTGFDNNEPYAFLSFIAANGVTISRAVLTETNSSGAFEADNFTVIAGTPSALGTLVLVSGVPEPSTWALLLVGVGLVAWTLRRSRELAA